MRMKVTSFTVDLSHVIIIIITITVMIIAMSKMYAGSDILLALGF